MPKTRKQRIEEKLRILHELQNKAAESPHPHEHDMVYNVLGDIINDYKLQLIIP